jgi:hypothetical protein
VFCRGKVECAEAFKTFGSTISFTNHDPQQQRQEKQQQQKRRKYPRFFTFETAASSKRSSHAHILELAVLDVSSQEHWSSLVNPSLHGIAWELELDAAERSGGGLIQSESDLIR